MTESTASALSSASDAGNTLDRGRNRPQVTAFARELKTGTLSDGRSQSLGVYDKTACIAIASPILTRPGWWRIARIPSIVA